MALPVFKTGEAEHLGLAGSIPVRLRHSTRSTAGSGPAAWTTEHARTSRRDRGPARVPRTDVCWPIRDWSRRAARLGSGLVRRPCTAPRTGPASGAISPDEVADDALDSLPHGSPSMRPVINATGVVAAHQPRPSAAVGGRADGCAGRAAGYADVEFDLGTGRRARRGRGACAALAEAVPAAEDGATW